jgi:hypothetical protein
MRRPALQPVYSTINSDFPNINEDYRSLLFSIIIRGNFLPPEFTVPYLNK